MIIACYFSVKAFSIEEVGSVGNLFELVQAAAQRHPVSGNQDGTYLTMKSKSVSSNTYTFPKTSPLTIY
jgi:Na+/proline symporter